MSTVPFSPIPESTVMAAKFVFGENNFYLVTGNRANDLFGGLLLGEGFLNGVPQPHVILAILYLVTIFQYIEMLSDSLAAQALRTRVDWKYALHLPLDFPGVEPIALCHFRHWLYACQGRLDLLQVLFSRVSSIALATSREIPSRSASNVVEAVCLINWLETVWSAIKQALDVLAIKRPAWLEQIYQPQWYLRYAEAPKPPVNRFDDCANLVHTIGEDGFRLLTAVADANQSDLSSIPEIVRLEQVWREQYLPLAEGVVWRKLSCATCPHAH